MKPKVYIETSVISYYAARPSRDVVIAGHQQVTNDWWDNSLPQFDIYVSQAVIEEISKGDIDAVQKRLAVVKDFNILAINSEIISLANSYFSLLQLPEKARTDSLHLAIAVWHNLDYLVSWNCAHLASARVRAIIDKVNDQKGIASPLICTPEELTEG